MLYFVNISNIGSVICMSDYVSMVYVLVYIYVYICIYMYISRNLENVSMEFRSDFTDIHF